MYVYEEIKVPTRSRSEKTMAVCEKGCPLSDSCGCRSPENSGSLKPGLDPLADLLMDGLDGFVPGDDGDPVRLSGGDFLILVVDAAIERFTLGFEAPLVLSGGTVIAAAGARERAAEVRKKKDGQVGVETAAKGAVHLEDDFAAQLPASALVGFARIGVAVA